MQDWCGLELWVWRLGFGRLRLRIRSSGLELHGSLGGFGRFPKIRGPYIDKPQIVGLLIVSEDTHKKDPQVLETAVRGLALGGFGVLLVDGSACGGASTSLSGSWKPMAFQKQS